MTTFAVNEKNDIFLGDDGNMVVEPTGLQATLLVCEHYAKAQLREMIYQQQQGVPYDDTVFSDLKINQFRGNLGRQLLRVKNVIEIPSLIITTEGDVLSYRVTIKTTFGVGTINGII
jgi:hypothetical protein